LLEKAKMRIGTHHFQNAVLAVLVLFLVFFAPPLFPSSLPGGDSGGGLAPKSPLGENPIGGSTPIGRILPPGNRHRL